jgi:hypothetical protein
MILNRSGVSITTETIANTIAIVFELLLTSISELVSIENVWPGQVLIKNWFLLLSGIHVIYPKISFVTVIIGKFLKLLII